MGFKKLLGKFATLVKKFGPLVIHEVAPQLDPLASVVSHAIAEAEGIPGATGPVKLAHVQEIVTDAAATYNGLTHGPQIDIDNLHETIAHSVEAVVAATNVLVK